MHAPRLPSVLFEPVPSATLAAYARRWLGRPGRHRTAPARETERETLERYLLPALGPETPLSALSRERIADFLRGRLAAGDTPRTVRGLCNVLRALVTAAREEGVLTTNPCARLSFLIPSAIPPPADTTPAIAAVARAVPEEGGPSRGCPVVPDEAKDSADAIAAVEEPPPPVPVLIPAAPRRPAPAPQSETVLDVLDAPPPAPEAPDLRDGLSPDTLAAFVQVMQRADYWAAGDLLVAAVRPHYGRLRPILRQFAVAAGLCESRIYALHDVADTFPSPDRCSDLSVAVHEAAAWKAAHFGISPAAMLQRARSEGWSGKALRRAEPPDGCRRGVRRPRRSRLPPRPVRVRVAHRNHDGGSNGQLPSPRVRLQRLPGFGPDDGHQDAPAANLPTLSARPTLGEFAAWFLASCRRRLKVRSCESYEVLLRLHVLPGLGADTPLADLTRTRIRGFLTQERTRFAAGGVRLTLAVIRALLTAAGDEEILTANPAVRLGRLFPRRQENPREKAIPPEHLIRFLATVREMHPRLGPLFLVTARTGLRLGETLALQWADVNLTERTLCVQHTLDGRQRLGTPKGGRSRVVDLSADATACLAALQASAPPGVPWVFPGSRGDAVWARSWVRRAMYQACGAAEIPRYSPHTLRHGFASMLADEGVSPWILRDLLGHADLKTTQAYVKLRGRHRSEVDRLDRIGQESPPAHGGPPTPTAPPEGATNPDPHTGDSTARPSVPGPDFLPW